MIANKECPILPDNISADLRDFFESCWKQDQSERPLCSEIIDMIFKKRITFPVDGNSLIVDEFYEFQTIYY